MSNFEVLNSKVIKLDNGNYVVEENNSYYEVTNDLTKCTCKKTNCTHVTEVSNVTGLYPLAGTKTSAQHVTKTSQTVESHARLSHPAVETRDDAEAVRYNAPGSRMVEVYDVDGDLAGYVIPYPRLNYMTLYDRFGKLVCDMTYEEINPVHMINILRKNNAKD